MKSGVLQRTVWLAKADIYGETKLALRSQRAGSVGLELSGAEID